MAQDEKTPGENWEDIKKPNDENKNDDPLPPEPIGRGEQDKSASIAVTGGVRDVTKFMNEDAQKVKEALALQPKVDFYLPLEPGEKLGQAYETVTINGYRLEIKKGMMVSVPKQIAETLAEYLSISTSAGVEHRVDRDEKRQEALS
jgi:hypothetical protein